MKNKIGIIGCGNMGEAILARGIKHKDYRFLVSEIDKLKEAFICQSYRVKAARSIADLVSYADMVIIAVKPQDIDVVLDEIRLALQIIEKRSILLVSIAAGIKTEYIEQRVSRKIRVIRAMPNMPALIGKGISALTKGRYANNVDLKKAEKIFQFLGETIIIDKEDLINVVTVVSGSGPAYLFFIFSAMEAVAKNLKLKKKDAQKLLYHTIDGAIELLKEKNFTAHDLIAKIASKGGTTEAAFEVFYAKHLNEIIHDALFAAYKRAKELSRG